MIQRVALTGSIAAGKTSLALALEARDYVLLNFTDQIKQAAIVALNSCGVVVDMEDIKNQKSKYRAFLQELGGLLDEKKLLNSVLEPWLLAGLPNAVFDNVRTESQWSLLRSLGFTLVELQVSQEDRRKRLGKNADTEERLKGHPIERGIGVKAELILSGGTTQDYVRFIKGM